MEHQPHLSPWVLLLCEVTAGVSGCHLFDAIPAWVGGGLSALVVGVTLRVLDPALRRLGERLAARRSNPPPPSP